MDKNTRHLRIAIFHFGFFYSGGGEKLVLEEIKGLRKLGHDVTCFAPYIDRERCFPGVSEMAEVQTLLPPPPKYLPFRHAISVLLCCLLVPLMALRFRKFDVFTFILNVSYILVKICVMNSISTHHDNFIPIF